jgi:hypothetical protein
VSIREGITKKVWKVGGIAAIAIGGFNTVTRHNQTYDGSKDPSIDQWLGDLAHKQVPGFSELFFPWLDPPENPLRFRVQIGTETASNTSPDQPDANANILDAQIGAENRAQTAPSQNTANNLLGAAAVVANELALLAGAAIIKFR